MSTLDQSLVKLKNAVNEGTYGSVKFKVNMIVGLGLRSQFRNYLNRLRIAGAFKTVAWTEHRGFLETTFTIVLEGAVEDVYAVAKNLRNMEN